MPTGENLSRCHSCGKSFVCGDCIVLECVACECLRTGHWWYHGFCTKCGAIRMTPEQEKAVAEAAERVSRAVTDQVIRSANGSAGRLRAEVDRKLAGGADDAIVVDGH